MNLMEPTRRPITGPPTGPTAGPAAEPASPPPAPEEERPPLAAVHPPSEDDHEAPSTRTDPPQPLPPDHTQAILEATKEVGAVLKTSGCPFALVGSVAVYAHGIPVRLQHDTDFALRAEDAETVTRLLRRRGIRIVEPPEDWLVKARSGGEEIDLIFALAGRPVTRELLERAWTLPVDSVHMPVIDPTDLLVGRLDALSEHHCDFGPLLPVARGLRERVDWDRVRAETHDKPMAVAFLYLLELLDVIPRTTAAGDGGDDGAGDGGNDDD
ncbi:nucleotidyltransferase family protein [Streptomyces sp. NPDC059071]|uniref:nucleotidyltransferase family protein n=1 Tax=unclassified Streptomyces TaxID=2593676 RepID=UPI003657C5F0